MAICPEVNRLLSGGRNLAIDIAGRGFRPYGALGVPYQHDA